MGRLDLVVLSISLGSDATAVSICKGMSLNKIDLKQVVIISLYFGIFQAIMPVIGHLFGRSFASVISSLSSFIAFILLSLIGISLILDSFKADKVDGRVDFKTMFPLAVATSIDALTVGITFAFLDVNIYFAVALIGIITFILSFIGTITGIKFRSSLGQKSKLVGGIVLIFIGIKILLENLKII